ncbi:restriction endonuclease [Halanaerobium kushneri]|uniref:Restriction endonuclease n=1 Tax=Halanaerobium kushneri TaxID=56779 RepID=A0A1N6PG76_9FIRM|nr:restriction endonuclease [Halanaerobium kushneri]SIQ03344.1 Restriction endonuclease [Halanaerobium kushneri]
MSINFKRISSDGEDFELLCRDLLESKGIEVISQPSRGPDLKKDFIIKMKTKDKIGRKEEITYLVQCKHKAHSGKSVYESEIGNFQSACDIHNTDGYFLITSSVPSKTVQEQLEASNKNNKLKTCIWDRKKLEYEIENSTNFKSIIERYNLKEPLETIFTYIKSFALQELSNFFDFNKEVSKDDLKGLIFTQIIYNENGQKKEENHGYFCTLNECTESYIKKLKKQYKLESLIIVDNDTTGENILDTEQFYEHIQEYKDSWYQYKIWELFKYCGPVNPSWIRVIEKIIRQLPFKAQKITIENLKKYVSFNSKQVNIFLIIEAANAIAQLNLQELKRDVFRTIKNIPNLKTNNDTTISLLTSKLIFSLIKLEEENLELKEEFIQLFRESDNVKFKCYILDYFAMFEIEEISSDVLEMRKSSGEKYISLNHGIHYNNKQIKIVKNHAKVSISKHTEKYLNRINK